MKLKTCCYYSARPSQVVTLCWVNLKDAHMMVDMKALDKYNLFANFVASACRMSLLIKPSFDHNR